MRIQVRKNFGRVWERQINEQRTIATVAATRTAMKGGVNSPRARTVHIDSDFCLGEFAFLSISLAELKGTSRSVVWVIEALSGELARY